MAEGGQVNFVWWDFLAYIEGTAELGQVADHVFFRLVLKGYAERKAGLVNTENNAKFRALMRFCKQSDPDVFEAALVELEDFGKIERRDTAILVHSVRRRLQDALDAMEAKKTRTEAARQARWNGEGGGGSVTDRKPSVTEAPFKEGRREGGKKTKKNLSERMRESAGDGDDDGD